MVIAFENILMTMGHDEYIDWKLLVRRMNGELSKEEEQKFLTWLAKDTRRKAYYERMVAEWNSDTVRESDMSRELAKLDQFLCLQRKKGHQVMLRRRWLKWSVAAVLLVGLISSVYMLQRTRVEIPEKTSVAVITPGESKAILILSDGTSVNLDRGVDSTDTFIGVAKIKRNEGTILFEEDRRGTEMEYNTVITPKGGEYHVVLSDGSKVWLNADSKLKFPVNFGEGKREVFLSGEAYFEVVHDEGHPFVVTTDLGNVRVYGTQFNVRRYVDEEGIRATLVDGSVGFAKNGQKEDEYIKIEPGYQVRYEEGQEVVVQKVKVYNEIAWKNHQFSFERKPLDEIMKDFMRWYDVNITFEDESLHELYFSATLNRYGNIETLLRFFEAGYDIKFEINGKNIKIRRK